VEEDVEAKCFGAEGDGCADAAEAEDAEGGGLEAGD
jgi:hypothetical protein